MKLSGIYTIGPMWDKGVFGFPIFSRLKIIFNKRNKIMVFNKKFLNRYSFIVTMLFTVLITWNVATYNMHSNHELVVCPVLVPVVDIEHIVSKVHVEEDEEDLKELDEEINEVKVTSRTFNRYPDDIPNLDELDVIGFSSGVPGKLLRGMALKESHLDNTSVSPKGAKGMFQIVDRTANFLGVVNIKDNYESADAAARYLNHLHKRLFKTPFSEHTEYTMRITLASYNMGTKRLIRVGGGYEIPNWSEPREYVSDIIGYYNGTKYYVKRGDTLQIISKLHNIDISSLLKINGEDMHDLKYGVFVSVLVNSYVVQEGDTLYSISVKLKTTVKELKRINSIDNINIIVKNSVLIVS